MSFPRGAQEDTIQGGQVLMCINLKCQKEPRDAHMGVLSCVQVPTGLHLVGER